MLADAHISSLGYLCCSLSQNLIFRRERLSPEFFFSTCFRTATSVLNLLEQEQQPNSYVKDLFILYCQDTSEYRKLKEHVNFLYDKQLLCRARDTKTLWGGFVSSGFSEKGVSTWCKHHIVVPR